MARISSQKAANKIGSLYNMIIIAATRARELGRGDAPKVNCSNKNIITAIREIEQEKIGIEYLRKVGNANNIQRKSKNRNRK